MRLKPYRFAGLRRRGGRFLALGSILGATAVLAGLNGLNTDDLRLASSSDAADQAGLPSTPAAPAAPSFICEVDLVNDGDTLRCKDGTRVRLHAVAAREADETCSPGHPCPSASAASATALLNRLASGKTLRCEPTGRSFNRITAICWTPTGEELNCAMVRSGTTLVWASFARKSPLCRNTAPGKGL